MAHAPAFAQGNYEIQVYGSELVPPRSTMVELHSNFTFRGTKTRTFGALPTEHQLHETPASIFSAARSRARDGSGSAITSARGSRFRSAGDGRSG